MEELLKGTSHSVNGTITDNYEPLLMKLTAEEIKKIDNALEALKRSLKDEIDNAPGLSERFVVEDAYLKQIADAYLSEKGIISLLVDSNFIGVRKDSCSCSCRQPFQGMLDY